MSKFLTILSLAGGLAAAAYLGNWYHLYHAAIAVPLLLLVLLPVAMRVRADKQRQPRRSQRRAASGDGPQRAAWMGLVAAVAIAALLDLAFAIAGYLPFDRQWRDHDRATVEHVASALESKQHWTDAADLIRERLKRPTSSGWRKTLCQRLFDDLVQAATVAGDNVAVKLLNEAIALAKSEHLNSQAALARLELLSARASQQTAVARMTDEEALASASLDSATNEIDALRQRLAAAAERQARTELEAEDAKRASQLATYDALLSSAAHIESLDHREQQLQRALEWAAGCRLDGASSIQGLEQIAHERRQLAPAVLPAATRVTVHRVATDLAPPISVVEVAVETADGKPFDGLTAKDFAVAVDGVDAVRPWVASIPVAVEQPLSVVVLFDHSLSTAGEPLAAAKHGLAAFIARLPAGTAISVLSFSDTVVERVAWTTELGVVAPAIESLQASGNTALHAALLQGVTGFNGRNGVKAIVVFTDGANSVAGHSPDDVVAACETAQVPLHAIVLRTGSLDNSFLERITDSSGGRLYSATQADQLAELFVDAARPFQRTRYRLAVPTTHAPSEMSVQVGGSPGTSTTWQRNSPVAARQN